MNCPSCQQVLSDDARFCANCGSPTAETNLATKPIGVETQPETDQLTDPLIGQVLDSKYEIVARLGEGGMGFVYRARRLHIGDEVAVKVLHRDLISRPEMRERFRREARSAAMIRHPSVVTIHDFGEASAESATAYIVMELVHGKSLRAVLEQEGKLAPERAVSLMRDMCAGVGMAHRQGVVHRDLKPDNVMVVPPNVAGDRESVKVLDFGLAKLREAIGSPSLTQTGATFGTPYYMSPEQCRGEDLDARADVYSLGAMFYEMLSGAPPFGGNSLAALITKHLHEEPLPFAPEMRIPKPLETICRQALSKNAEQRQENATELSAQLSDALPSDSVRHASIKVPSKAVQKSAMPKIVWVGAALSVLFVLLLVVGALLIYQNRTSTNSERTTSKTTPSPTSAQSSTTATPNAAVDSTGLTGNWTGTYGLSNDPATLRITEDGGNNFHGILETGNAKVAFNGTVERTSRKIDFKETKVLSGDWSLGENSGQISADGRSMSGTGTDDLTRPLGISYPWTFVKQ